MAIDTFHASIIVEIFLQIVIILPMQFGLFFPVRCIGRAVAIRFHHAKITDTCSTTSIMAVDTLLAWDFCCHFVPDRVSRFILWDCWIPGTAQTIVII